MPVEIKFCGLTREADVRQAIALGAGYLGFIFAPSPRRLTIDDAAALFDAIDRRPDARAEVSANAERPRPLRVGVFADAEISTIAAAVSRLGLDIVQLHGARDARRLAGEGFLRDLRSTVGARIWRVIHVGPDGLDESKLQEAVLADGLLLDAAVDGMLGGTGRSFDWTAVRRVIEPLRGTIPIILAGGLRAENVARAIEVFTPDIVDVSSGVEAAPGRKDPARMRAFADAVLGVVLP